MSVGLIILGIVLILGGIALVIFVGRAMQSDTPPDVTWVNPDTGQSAPAGKSGLIVFIIIGIVLVIAGIGSIVGGAKG